MPSGLSIVDFQDKILRFVENEYAYYDGIPSSEPNRITPMDVLVSNAVNSNVNTADKMKDVHSGLARACNPILSMIPEQASLIDPLNEPLVRRLLRAACSVRFVLLPVATKVLHRKRRNLIPMLDNVVLRYYEGESGVATAQAKREAPAVGMSALRKFRADLRSCRPALTDLTNHLALRGIYLSDLRVLEASIWMETEPVGYYR